MKINEHESSKPADHPLHDLVTRIGQNLSLTSNDKYDLMPCKVGVQLQFSRFTATHWHARLAPLQDVVLLAEKHLFGDLRTGKYSNTNIVLSPHGHAPDCDKSELEEFAGQPAYFDDQSIVIGDKFWESFEPGIDATESWNLLTGHMQRIYVELISRVMQGEDHRPALLRMVAMKPAVQRCFDRYVRQLNQQHAYIGSHQYLIMPSLPATHDRLQIADFIRSFLASHYGETRHVTVNPGESKTFNIESDTAPTLVFNVEDYLAIDLESDELVTFKSARVHSSRFEPVYNTRMASSDPVKPVASSSKAKQKKES